MHRFRDSANVPYHVTGLALITTICFLGFIVIRWITPVFEVPVVDQVCMPVAAVLARIMAVAFA